MGAVAFTSQKQPAGNSGEPTPEAVNRIDFTRQQEIQCLTDYYETRMRILQDTHKEEKRALEKENQKLRNENRVQKIVNTKLRKNYTRMMEVEADLQAELQEVKITMKKLQEDKDTEIIKIKHRREKGFLMEEIRDLRNFVKSLKVTNTNWKKDCEERMKVQKELQEELQTLRVMKNKLQKKCDELMGTEMKLRTELGRVKDGNHNLNNYWEMEMKDCEEEKKILVLRNQELQKELEAIKKRGINTADDGIVSLHDFQFIRKLGEGSFGTVVLTKGKLPGGPEQLYAIKALKKRNITTSTISEIMAEKEAFMLTSGHPFITTMYSCFQNTGHLFFVMEYMSGGNLKEQLDEVEFFSEKRAKFYAAEIVLAVQFLHQHGILHRDLKLENVLVGSDGHCKIADFGLSKLGLFRHCKTTTKCGTPFCMAPEIVKNLPYGQGVDWWAVGVMIYEMMTGYPPFDYDEEEDMDGDSAEEKLEDKILNDEVTFPDNMSLAAISIVMMLLMKNSQKRLGSTGSVDAVRQHPFFKGIDWKALQEKRVQPPEEEKAAKKLEEGKHGFSKFLRDDNTSYISNQTLFQGFSFMNYRVK
jgi:serine/threonine protein kinase